MTSVAKVLIVFRDNWISFKALWRWSIYIERGSSRSWMEGSQRVFLREGMHHKYWPQPPRDLINLARPSSRWKLGWAPTHIWKQIVYSQRSEASLVVPRYLMKTVNVPPKKQCWYILSFELQSNHYSLIFQFLLFGIFLFVGIRLFVQPLDRAYNHLFSFHRVFFRLSLDKHFPQPRHRQTQACWSCLCNQPASGEFMATGFRQF